MPEDPSFFELIEFGTQKMPDVQVLVTRCLFWMTSISS